MMGRLKIANVENETPSFLAIEIETFGTEENFIFC